MLVFHVVWELNSVVFFAMQTAPPSNIHSDDVAWRRIVGQANGNDGNSQVVRNLFPSNNRNGTAFISSQQLSRVAKGRVTRSRSEQVWMANNTFSAMSGDSCELHAVFVTKLWKLVNWMFSYNESSNGHESEKRSGIHNYFTSTL